MLNEKHQQPDLSADPFVFCAEDQESTHTLSCWELKLCIVSIYKKFLLYTIFLKYLFNYSGI